jgi:hypothetical protein
MEVKKEILDLLRKTTVVLTPKSKNVFDKELFSVNDDFILGLPKIQIDSLLDPINEMLISVHPRACLLGIVSEEQGEVGAMISITNDDGDEVSQEFSCKLFPEAKKITTHETYECFKDAYINAKYGEFLIRRVDRPKSLEIGFIVIKEEPEVHFIRIRNLKKRKIAINDPEIARCLDESNEILSKEVSEEAK